MFCFFYKTYKDLDFLKPAVTAVNTVRIILNFYFNILIF